MNDILSNKSKKIKKYNDEKPYFENTHQIFTPSWINYKNPSLNKEDDEDFLEEGEKMPTGKALLKKIYGGAVPTDISLYSKAKQIADKTYSKPSAYKSGFIQKKYKEMGGDYKDDGEKPLKRWFEEDWKDIGNKEYPVYRPTKRVSKKTPLTATEIDPKQAVSQIDLKQKIKGNANLPPFANKRLKAKGGSIPCGTSCKKKVKDHYDKVVDNYTDVITHLEEHLQEKVGDPLDAKQAKTLKREVKRVNELHLIPAMKVGSGDPLYKVSNPREVQKKAFETYGKDAIVYKSSRPKKKYQMVDKLTGKMVFFGDANMEDFTKHQDEVRKERYLKRALNIRGNWRTNPFSPNVLSILLLW